MIRVIDNHRTELSPIPSGWVHTRMKAAVKNYQHKKNEDESPTVLSLTKTGVKIKTDLSFGKSTESYIGHQIVEKGQFVFTPRDFDATPILCGVSRYNGCISNLYIVFDISKKIYPKYLEYYFYGLKYGFDYFEKLSFGMRYSFNQKQFERIPLIYPKFEEQQEISDFLDQETSRIDQLVEKKSSLIKTLLEKQTSELEDLTFTNAKNGDWKKVPFKWVCSIPNGQVDPTQSPWLDMPLIAPNHIESGTGTITNIETARDQNAVSGKYRFPEGTVLYSKIRPALAKACIAPTAGICSADMYPLLPNKELMPEYLLMQILSRSFTDWATVESMRVAMPKINRDTLGDIKLLVPPLPVQRELISIWHKKKNSSASIINLVKDSVQKLLDYKSALITEAVTGQLDIQKWQQRGMTDRRLDKIEEDMEQSKRASA